MSNESKSLSICMFPADPYGCGTYRLIMPGQAMNEVGYNVSVSLLPDVSGADHQFDVYHFQRVTTPSVLEAMKRAKGKGLVCIDMDDDLFDLFPGHPSAWYYRKGCECKVCGHADMLADAKKCTRCGSDRLEVQDRPNIALEALKLADCITVSTPELYEEYKGMNANIEILPNYVDFQAFARLNNKTQPPLMVGWAGSFTHVLDLSLISKALEVINDYPNVYFAITGIDPVETNKMFGHLSDKLVILDPVDVWKYPQLLKNFDIGLAPLNDNKFNRGKSELKAMEYGAAGVPTIASPVAPYLRYIEHGKDGFLAKKHSDWVKYLRLLIENDDLRAEMAENAVSKAEKMDIRANLEPRIALYERLFAEIGAERVARAAELVEAVQDKQEINPGGIFGGLNV